MRTVIHRFEGTPEKAVDRCAYLAAVIGVATLVRPVLRHPDFAKFPASVGFLRNGSRKHHYYEGGLAVHTAQVLESVWYMGDFHALSSCDIAASLMRWGATVRTREARAAIKKIDFDADLFPRTVGHLIASHHGTREWGSPDAPSNMMAVLLHQADMQSLVQDGNNPYTTR